MNDCPKAAWLPNLRDLGGFSNRNGQTTKREVIYRSSLPFAGDRRPSQLRQWPPRTVIDLRSPKERSENPQPMESSGFAFHHVGLMTDRDVAAQRESKTLDELYLRVIGDAGERFARVIEIVATADAPILIHCGGGKDRTGMVCALLLRLAGVGPEHILGDYLTTNQHMPAVLSRVNPMGSVSEDDDFLRADPAAIGSVIAYWDDYPGGVRGWSLDRGAAADSIGAFVRRFLTDQD